MAQDVLILSLIMRHLISLPNKRLEIVMMKIKCKEIHLCRMTTRGTMSGLTLQLINRPLFPETTLAQSILWLELQTILVQCPQDQVEHHICLPITHQDMITKELCLLSIDLSRVPFIRLISHLFTDLHKVLEVELQV